MRHIRVFVLFALLLGSIADSGEKPRLHPVAGESEVFNSIFSTTLEAEDGYTGISLTFKLSAQYKFSVLGGRPTRAFATRLRLLSVRMPDAGIFTADGDGFDGLDSDEAIEAFNAIKLIKASFHTTFGEKSASRGRIFIPTALYHAFTDQEVFAPQGRWGQDVSALLDWDKLFFGSNEAENKKLYEIILSGGDIVEAYFRLEHAEFTGLLEFRDAVQRALRDKEKEKSRKKPAITADDLKKAFGGEKQENREKEPEERYAVTADDLKNALGGTALSMSEEDTVDDQDKSSADWSGLLKLKVVPRSRYWE